MRNETLTLIAHNCDWTVDYDWRANMFICILFRSPFFRICRKQNLFKTL